MSLEGLTQIDILTGFFSSFFAVVCIIMGIIIISKYLKFQRKELFTFGLTWIFLGSSWWGSSLSFFNYLFFDVAYDFVLLLFIGEVFFPLTVIFWLYSFSYILYPNSKNKIALNKTGNPGLSKAGTGDVLAGLAAGFLAKTQDLFKSAVAASFINGHIGDLLLKKKKDMVEDTRIVVVGCAGKFNRVKKIEEYLKGKKTGALEIDGIGQMHELKFTKKRSLEPSYLERCASVQLERGISNTIRG